MQKDITVKFSPDKRSDVFGALEEVLSHMDDGDLYVAISWVQGVQNRRRPKE